MLRETQDPHSKLSYSEGEAFLPHVYEISGNSAFMHASDEEEDTSKVLYPVPS